VKKERQAHGKTAPGRTLTAKMQEVSNPQLTPLMEEGDKGEAAEIAAKVSLKISFGILDIDCQRKD